jgi:2-oxo-3-hexenedioate decarboxylase
MNLDAIAHDLIVAQDSRTLVAPITNTYPDFDHAAGYQVSQRIHRARLRAGATKLGRKIGFTNRNIWPEYGVYEPIWAYVYDTTVQRLPDNRGACALSRFALPRIEPEVVFHFHRAPPRTREPSAILACVDWIAHGYEIVQSHFADWKFKVVDTIADSGLHGTLLVGAPQPIERLGAQLLERLSSFAIELSCDDKLRDRGRGANVLDSPVLALAHLIEVLATQTEAEPIEAGELVTTGTLTAALPIRAGETWSTKFDGLDLPGLVVRFE